MDSGVGSNDGRETRRNGVYGGRLLRLQHGHSVCSLSLCLVESGLGEGGCEPGGQRSWGVERRKIVTMAQCPLLSLSSA